MLTESMLQRSSVLFAFVSLFAGICSAADAPLKTTAGMVSGATSTDSKIRIYKGIPFAAAPVGDLRWKPPQPAPTWEGVRQATEFGPRCMQAHIFADMVFRDSGPSEDCLTVNVWTPAATADAHLPVMVWIFGGGFQAGGTSEPRQDGEVLAHRGVVVVSVNYRLGIFGFLSHPELENESPQHASGNYGLLDQVAGLQWVHDNIAAFGGDPGNVTIFGESAGSMSVSSLVATPLAKNLFQHAIGESGGATGLEPTRTKADAEENGAKFGQTIGASSLKDLRALDAKKLLDASLAAKGTRFGADVDGYYFPESAWDIYSKGQQSHVALLAGWNTDEQPYQSVIGPGEPIAESYAAKLKERFGAADAEQMLKLYAAKDPAEIKLAAGALAGDRWIAYATWRWLEFQLQTGQAPVYRYHFEQAPPMSEGEPTRGAYHSSDIEYVFGNLDWKKLAWTDGDRKVSDLMQTYWTNFAKTGDPNGGGAPQWPVYNAAGQYPVMHLNPAPNAAPDKSRPRYLYWDGVAAAKRDEKPAKQQ